MQKIKDFYREVNYVHLALSIYSVISANVVCVRGSTMVSLVGNIFTICTNLITNDTIGKEIGANGKNGNAIGTNGTNVTNQWYHWENPEHTHTYRMFV